MLGNSPMSSRQKAAFFLCDSASTPIAAWSFWSGIRIDRGDKFITGIIGNVRPEIG
jgi:hypothetical protein